MRTTKKRKTTSTLEVGFARLFEAFGKEAPAPEREFVFHPTRKWRIDFAWPRHRVAVEIDGGIFIRGGHNRGKAFSSNAEKHNAMTMMGWRLLRFDTLSLRTKPVQCIEMVIDLLSKITPLDQPSQQELFKADL